MKYNIDYSQLNKRLGFCFLIYDKINHEDLWYDFFKNIDRSKYEIFIYFKTDKPLKYFENFKLKNCIEPKKNCIETSWGDYKISLAQNLMMKKGIKKCSHFIFLSGSCIPLKNFDYIYEYLDNDFSYFNKAPDEQVFPRCNYVLNYIDKKYIKKANTNAIINNSHARIIINNEDLLKKWFSNVNNADEHCHITLLYYFGKENELKLTDNTSYSGATTFAAWEDMKDFMTFPKSIKSNAYTYEMISKDELTYLINSPCLFGRKFTEKCTMEGKSLKDSVLKMITPLKGGLNNKYLLFSSISRRGNGKQALEYWSESDRNYDIVLAYYKDEVPENCSDFCFKRNDFKLPNFHYYASNYDITKYDAIFLIDDDIFMKSQDINKMFDIFIKNNLLVAAPSMDSESDVHYWFQKQNNNNKITFTNFVEIGTLILHKKTIPKLLPLFEESGSGWGTDIILPHIIKPNEKQMGIINEVSCHHPKIIKKEDFTKSSSMCLDGSCTNKEVFDKGYALLNKYNVKTDIRVFN